MKQADVRPHMAYGITLCGRSNSALPASRYPHGPPSPDAPVFAPLDVSPRSSHRYYHLSNRFSTRTGDLNFIWDVRSIFVCSMRPLGEKGGRAVEPAT